jgi:hypothetical protein
MSTVTEKTFLTEEELNTLKDIQTRTRRLINEFGEIELIKIQIENRHKNAEKFLSDLTSTEQEFTQSVFNTYGRVNIDPETGELTTLG